MLQVVTLNSDDSRGVIYAPRVINYAPREHIVQALLIMIVIYD
jgi:hypothetical protein